MFNKNVLILILLIFLAQSLKAQAGYGIPHSAGDNIVDSNGTVWLITNVNGQTVRRAYTSAGAFLSYGFNSWNNIQPAGSIDLSLPEGGFVPPRDGKIICSDQGADKGTCYLITNGQKAGFTSESVFKNLGYSFARAISGDISWMASTSLIENYNQAHRPGTLINDSGTIYLITQSGLLGIPDMQTFSDWGYSLDDVVPANNFDRNLPKNNAVIPRRQAGQLSPTAVSSNNTPITGKPNPSPAAQTCHVYTYQDRYMNLGERYCIDKVVLKGVYFVAKDQQNFIKSYWQSSMQNIFTQIKNFYEQQFNYKIQITIDTPVIVYGNKNITDYNFYSIFQEVKQKVQNTYPPDYFFDYSIFVINGSDGNGQLQQGDLGGSIGVAAQGSFLLNPDSLGSVTTKYGTDYSGYLTPAHEFGHTLGIPHPWEEEGNRDVYGNIIDPNYGNNEKGSLMSYGGQLGPLIPNAFIRTTVKQKMISQ
jgi:hypothetical protein